MSTNRSQDRASSCTFTFSDGRRCRAPRSDGHPYLCAFHARKEAQALAGEKAGQDIAFFLSGDYVSAGDLTFALGRLFAAVAQGGIKPKTTATFAYLGQTLAQILHLAQNEYITGFGSSSWARTVGHNLRQSGNRQCPPLPKAPPEPTSTEPAPQPSPIAPPVPKTGSNSAPN